MSERTSLYYEKIRQHFLERFDERERRERGLTPETYDAFSDADEAYTKAAIKFLEAGAEARVEDDLIIINAGERECEIYKDNIIGAMGKDEFYDFFPDQVETSIVDGPDDDPVITSYDEDNEDDVSEPAEDEPIPEPQKNTANAENKTASSMPGIDPELAAQNPFYAMMQMMSGFFGQMANIQAQQPRIEAQAVPPVQPTPTQAEDSSKKDNAIMESTLSDIKGKTERLEREKSNAIKSFKVVEQKSKRLESEVNRRLRAQKEAEDKCSEAIHERDAVLEELNSEIENKNRLQEENASLKSGIHELKVSLDKATEALNAELQNVEELKHKAQTDIEVEQQRSADALKAEREKANERVTEATNKANSRISELERQLNNKTNQLRDNDKRLAEARKSISDLQIQVDSLNSQIEQAKKSREEAEALRAEYEKIVAENNAKAEKIEQLTVEIAELKSAEEELKASMSNVSEEQFKELTEKIAALQAENDSLHEEVDEARRNSESAQNLAFEDTQTGTLNSNALNNDLRNIDVSKIVMAQINIKGVRDININYGKKMGDKLIKSVAGKTKEVFAGDKVYRVLGDNFIIISEKSYDKVREIIRNLKTELKNNEMDIVTVVCDGSEFNSIQEIVSQCEKDINHQRVYGDNDDSFVEKPESSAPTETSIEGVEEIDDDIEDVDPEDINFDDDED